MLKYVVGRLIFALVAIFIISIFSFMLIKAPPGDYLSSQIARLQASGMVFSDEQVDTLRKQYGLDKSTFVQYFRWLNQLLHGNLGHSLYYKMPAADLLAQTLPFTIILAVITLVFVYVVSIPIGIFSAVKQYTIFDHVFTITGFVGISVPNFVLALVVMYFFYKTFGISIGGLYSPEFAGEAWSWAKFIDLLQHLWAPVIVVGLAGTAAVIRVIRAAMLDELGKDYMAVARAKGLSEFRLLIKYPTRVALSPILSTIGWQLPNIIGYFVIAGIVLNLPIIGPVLLNALASQDMYPAGVIVLILSIMTVLGTILSDILLAIADPRIRYI